MKKKKRIILGLICFSAILFIIFLIYINGTHAIYTKKSSWDYMYKSSKIYIDSSLIKEGASYAYNYYDGEDITFTINNYLDEMLTSEKDIHYSLECSSDNNKVSCLIEDSRDNTLSALGKCYTSDSIINLEKGACLEQGYNYLYDKVAKTHILRVTREDNGISSASVKLVLKVDKPYEKVISSSLKFNFSGKRNIISYGLKNDNTLMCDYYIDNNYNVDKKVMLISNNNFFLEDKVMTLEKNASKIVRLAKNNSSVSCSSNNFSYALYNTTDDVLKNLNVSVTGSLLSGTYSSTSSYLNNKYYAITINKNSALAGTNLSFSIKLKVKEMDEALTSSQVHWYLTEVVGSSETVISNGNFSNIVTDSDIDVLSNRAITATSKEYRIRLWLEDSNLQNKNIEMYPYLEINNN